MTRMTPLLGRNEQFARAYTPVALGLPTAQVIVVTCLDHRVDPAIVLGLQLGDAPVVRQGRRRAPAHLTLALTEGERVRSRLRHRHRARHHHPGCPVPVVAAPVRQAPPPPARHGRWRRTRAGEHRQVS